MENATLFLDIFYQNTIWLLVIFVYNEGHLIFGY